jgi:hypothetical protein
VSWAVERISVTKQLVCWLLSILEVLVAKKTIRVSDVSGAEIADGKGATVRITFADARKGVRELDVTDAEAEAMGGRPVGRRGRRPKNLASRQ